MCFGWLYNKRNIKKNAQPEFIITFNTDLNTIIVVECKKSLSFHKSKNNDRSAQYAVDGVLYYAKYSKDEFNVIAIAQSGTDIQKMLVSTFYWVYKNTQYDIRTQ